ncbi:MAG: response regulator [Chloroflexota bacterium]
MKRILIVEDVDLNLDLLIQLLEDDYEFLVARNGASGVEMAVSEKPDLILMDMSLPIMDGWEATRRIKSTKNIAQIPVIGLSAHAMAGDREKALGAGCDDYLTKPVDEDLLFETLEKYFN